MKKTLILLALMCVIAGLASAQNILHYWNFNTGTPATDTNWPQNIPANTGTGQISYTFSEAWSFTGTNINGVDGETNGGSFCPRGGVDMVNNGQHFTITAPTTGMENIFISYATRKTSTGFATQEVLYTTDGSNWISKETLSLAGFENNWVASQVFTIDFSEIPAVNNNASFAVRIKLDGSSSAVGNNRFDNLKIIGSTQGGVAMPTFNPPAGAYTQPVNVTINSTTPGATIRYTLDGSEPTTSSSVYSTPISISNTTTVKAKAWADGLNPSMTATAAYMFPVVVENLSQLRAQNPDNSTLYHVTGNAILTFKQSNRNQKYVQDAGAAVLIDDQPGVITSNYQIGDAIQGITGKLSMYFETLQFLPTLDPGPAVSSGNYIHVPTVTVSQLNGDIGFNNYQSRLVLINDVSFTSPSGNYTTNPAVSYDISDPTGAMTFRTAFYDADYINTPMHTGSFSVRGLISHFQSTAQITPRMLTDFNPVSNTDEVQSPAQVALIGNFPNPFNPQTTIQFQMQTPAPAAIEIFNQKGQVVKNFDIQQAQQGMNSLVWNGLDNNGSAVSSGVYFFRLKSGSYSSTKKMVLMK
jgi:hypothetical protein